MNIEVFNLIGRFKNRSINHINIYAMVFAGIFAFVAAFVVIFNEYLDFNREISKIEQDYMKSQKRVVFQKSQLLKKIIEYNDKNSENKTELQNEISKMVTAFLSSSDNKISYFILSSGEKIYATNNFNHILEVKKEIEDIKKKGGGFLEYKTGGKKHLLYIDVYNRTGWIYGSGVSIEDIKEVIKKRREIYEKKISGFILKIVFLTFILYIFSILKYRYFTDKVSRELKYILNAFEDASNNYSSINIKELEFDEFRQIAIHANEMIRRIKQKNRELMMLNENLESLVEQKTKELQESVEYTKELLEYQDKFVKNAIHEINTPLSIILMNVELHNLKYEKNHYLTKIEAAVKVLENIYGDLGYIVKKDRVEYKKKMINFSIFLKERAEYFEEVAKGNELRLKLYVEDDIFIFFNEVELQRLCDNNISNAIKYSYPKEVILIKLYEKNGCVVFEVSNIGDEIKEPSKLFERFYREDSARGGFGLGLNIVKTICDENGVKIDVKSNKKLTVFSYFFECKGDVE